MKRCHPDSSDSDQNQETQSKQMKADTAVVLEEICRLFRIIEDAKAADPNLLTTSPFRPDLKEVEDKILELLPLLKTPAASDDVMPENI